MAKLSEYELETLLETVAAVTTEFFLNPDSQKAFENVHAPVGIAGVWEVMAVLGTVLHEGWTALKDPDKWDFIASLQRYVSRFVSEVLEHPRNVPLNDSDKLRSWLRDRLKFVPN